MSPAAEKSWRKLILVHLSLGDQIKRVKIAGFGLLPPRCMPVPRRLVGLRIPLHWVVVSPPARFDKTKKLNRISHQETTKMDVNEVAYCQRSDWRWRSNVQSES